MNPDLIFHSANQVVTVDPDTATNTNPLGIIENGAVAVKNGKIVWVGHSSEIDLNKHPDAEWVDATGSILLPGFIDSHTHPIFAGNRADEFEKRLQGKTYLEIAAEGGGILKTVQATRNASEEELYTLAHRRLLSMLSYGVTTVEGKSGYGLDFESELKSLRVLNRLKENVPLSLFATYMGAHDIPPEHKQNANAYVTELCEQQIPKVAQEKLATFCDVFCEEGYFSVEQSRKILQTAKDHGLKLKIHAEEFTDLGGATLAGEVGAVSADHLLHISESGMDALKAGNVVATLLPGTAFFLRLKRYAPARRMLEKGVTVALATDMNPGSCMTENIQWIMTLACLEMNMTPVEVIQGVTINAAKALDLQNDRGSLTIGKRADILVCGVDSYHELLYHYGKNHVRDVFIAGKNVWVNTTNIQTVSV